MMWATHPPTRRPPTCFSRSILDRFHRGKERFEGREAERVEHGQRIYFSRAKFMYDAAAMDATRRDGIRAHRYRFKNVDGY